MKVFLALVVLLCAFETSLTHDVNGFMKDDPLIAPKAPLPANHGRRSTPTPCPCTRP